MVKSVIVIGAGVIGLTTAVVLAEAGHRIRVVADEIPGAASLAAGASWGPYHAEPFDKVNTWGAHTLQALAQLAETPGTGVRMVPGLEASRTATRMPGWASLVPGVTECEIDEIPAGFQAGWRYTVPVVDMARYLGYLRARLHAAGGAIERRHVNNLSLLAGAAGTLINCTGIGARDLTPDDSVYPIRGQLVIVSNPGIDSFFSEDTGSSPNLTHYLPQTDSVVLGGIARTGDWSREIDPHAAQAIVDRCVEIEPLLRNAAVLEHRIGLRPSRPQVRLEAARVGDTLVIHNYGHGGAGVSLSWGCAADVLVLAS